MQKLLSEPVMVAAVMKALIVLAIVIAAMAFKVDITVGFLGMVMVAVEGVLAPVTRAQVTPVSTLPPGVAAQIADQKAAQ